MRYTAHANHSQRQSVQKGQLLMTIELDDQIRQTLRSDASTDRSRIGDAIEDVSRRYDRRRRTRRLVTATTAVALVIGGLAGVTAIRGDRPQAGQQVPGSTAPPMTSAVVVSSTEAAPAAELSLLSIDVTVRPDGEDLVFTFDQPFPSRELAPWDPARGIGDSLSYGVQSPERIQNCAATHGNAGPGMQTGSFDIYIPADWWNPTAQARDYELNWQQPKSLPSSVPGPGLIFACGPYDGYIQYTVTAPSSDELGDIHVTISPSGDQLRVEVRT